MKVAPTEPPSLRALGQTSSLPEKFGVDVLFSAHGRWHGVQRKELKDLLASLEDGRLARELVMMQRCDRAYLLIEGTPRWTRDGEMILTKWSQRFTITQYRGLIWSVQDRGFGVMHSTGLADTVQMLDRYEKWQRKAKHSGLKQRPGPTSVWGRAGNHDYACHLLQGIPGIGPELADRIVNTVGIPFGLRVSDEELLAVEGMGPKKLEAVKRALGP